MHKYYIFQFYFENRVLIIYNNRIVKTVFLVSVKNKNTKHRNWQIEVLLWLL